MSSAEKLLQEIVLPVHRRNGGQLTELDFTLALLDPSLRLDSLDLAEIMAAIEHKCGKSPFDGATPPRTWRDISDFIGAQG
jgi:hypothetical protein